MDAPALPSSSRLREGARVGTFRVQRWLGEGASGVVYEATVEPESNGMPATAREGQSPELAAGTRVALKVVHAHLLKDRQIVQRFRREARILRQLRGDHLVSLLAYGETDDGLLFMALEYIEGTPLDVLARQRLITTEQALELMRQICMALEVAHEAGVVHRDLKPGNVIVQHTPGGLRARVLDFGLAKVLRGEAGDSLNSLTEQNMVFGTPEYMAPEQARGEEVDGRADVYAAGVILYELITGTVPFSSPSPIGTMTAHLTEEPEPPSRRARDREVPPAVEAIVLHALSKRREARYASARALGQACVCAAARPEDVESTRPPRVEEAALHDTQPSLERPSGLLATTRPVEVSLPGPGSRSRLGAPWILAGLLAVLLGVALGIIFSLMGTR